MAIFIKSKNWENLSRGNKGSLNLDELIEGHITENKKEGLLVPISGSDYFLRLIGRNNQLAIDRQLTSTGFLGVEGVDWENTNGLNLSLSLFNELVIGLADSVNTTFSTTYGYIPLSSNLYLNGRLCTKNVDYTEILDDTSSEGLGFEMISPPVVDAILIANYVRKSLEITSTPSYLNSPDSAEFITYMFDSVGDQSVDINYTNKTIGITVPAGTNVVGLTSFFSTSPNITSIRVGSVDQVNMVTTNNFTNPVVYTIIAPNNVTSTDWTITVTVSL